jgi:quercetin dioxygenase-like cupin family protein
MKAGGMGILVKGLREAGALVSASDSQQIRSGLVVLEQGKEVGKHETGGGEELIVLLEGVAELVGDGETRTVHAPLRYVYVYVKAMDDS